MLKRSGKKEFRIDQKPEFQQKLVDLARVTRIVAGGKRLRFRATMVIGNQKGKVGFGVAKDADVPGAIGKAVKQAKKNIIQINFKDKTILFEVRAKYKGARIFVKPASIGHGLVAGGAVRIVLALAGVKDATAKILGGKNKINNIKATFEALKQLKY